MGALHDGHASLMRVARDRVGPGPVVVSIFVNPLQFGPTEDLERYPRTLDADLELCADEGVDVVFAPSVDEVYPGGEPQVTVEPGPLGHDPRGRDPARPLPRRAHRRGQAVRAGRPDVAVFGQKDYQQLTLIRRMVADLCQGVEVVGAETRREPDGLAMSSRNRYLDAEQREQATALSRTLRRAQAAGRRRRRRRARARPAPSCAPRRASTSTTWWSPTPTWRPCRPSYLPAPRGAS